MFNRIRQIWRDHLRYQEALRILENMAFLGGIAEAVAQLHRHRVAVMEYDKWLSGEFPETRLVLKSLKAEVIGGLRNAGTPTIDDDGPFTVSSLREALRLRQRSSKIGHYRKPDNIVQILDCLRNPYGHDEVETRAARWEAAALLDPAGANYRCWRCAFWTSRALCPDCGSGPNGMPSNKLPPCDHIVGIDWGNPNHEVGAIEVRQSSTRTSTYDYEPFDYCPDCGQRMLTSGSYAPAPDPADCKLTGDIELSTGPEDFER